MWDISAASYDNTTGRVISAQHGGPSTQRHSIELADGQDAVAHPTRWRRLTGTVAAAVANTRSALTSRPDNRPMPAVAASLSGRVAPAEVSFFSHAGVVARYQAILLATLRQVKSWAKKASPELNITIPAVLYSAQAGAHWPLDSKQGLTVCIADLLERALQKQIAADDATGAMPAGTTALSAPNRAKLIDGICGSAEFKSCCNTLIKLSEKDSLGAEAFGYTPGTLSSRGKAEAIWCGLKAAIGNTIHIVLGVDLPWNELALERAALTKAFNHAARAVQDTMTYLQQRPDDLLIISEVVAELTRQLNRGRDLGTAIWGADSAAMQARIIDDMVNEVIDCFDGVDAGAAEMICIASRFEIVGAAISKLPLAADKDSVQAEAIHLAIKTGVLRGLMLGSKFIGLA